MGKQITQLFQSARHQTNLENIEAALGPVIIKVEVIYALNALKNKKAAGPDELPTEFVELIEVDEIYILVNLINTLYTTEIIPYKCLLKRFITLSKKKMPSIFLITVQ